MKKTKIKNLYLHIGSHKTGSTYIQRFFSDNRELLIANNLLFPVSGFNDPLLKKTLSSTSGHSLYYHNLVTGNDDSVFLKLQRELKHSGCENVFISSEDMFNNQSIDVAHKFHHLFDIDNLKIIVFLRRQDLYIESYYKERLRWNRYHVTSRIEDFINDNFEKLLDYKNRIIKWFEFSGGEILVYSYDDLLQQPIEDIFLGLLDLGDLKNSMKLPVSNRLNKSLDDRLAGLLALVNKYVEIDELNKTNLVRILSHARLPQTAGPSGLLGWETRKAIADKCKPWNISIANNYMMSEAPVFRYEKDFVEIPVAGQVWDINEIDSLMESFQRLSKTDN